MGAPLNVHYVLVFVVSVVCTAARMCRVCHALATCVHISVPFKVVRVQSIAWVGTSPPNLPASPLPPTTNYSIAIAKVS